MKNAAYFVIYNESNNNALTPKATFNFGDQIMQFAVNELTHQGSCFEELAGIPLVEIDGDMEYERDLTDEEIWNLSIEKLNDDGRFFYIYAANENGKQEFLKDAKSYYIETEAQALIDYYANN